MRPLKVVMMMNAGFFLVELGAGWWTNSLALLADAGHMLVDLMAVGLSLGAAWYSQQPASATKTYGYHRAEILAALLNGVVLWGLAVWIGVEAFHRFKNIPEILGGPMLVVAVCGLIVNLVSGSVLHRVSHENLNVQGAYLHVMFDVVGSLTAIAAGVAIVWKGWMWMDPLLSVATAGLMVWSAWKLIQEAVQILMEGVPSHVSVAEIQAGLLGVDGVSEVHDLHVWTLTSGFVAMSGHAVIADVARSHEILEGVRKMLSEKFHIGHMTLQLEPPHFGNTVQPLRRLS
jgi:cobalt-zinc-cadmium efflux system protein